MNEIMPKNNDSRHFPILIHETDYSVFRIGMRVVYFFFKPYTAEQDYIDAEME